MNFDIKEMHVHITPEIAKSILENKLRTEDFVKLAISKTETPSNNTSSSIAKEDPQHNLKPRSISLIDYVLNGHFSDNIDVFFSEDSKIAISVCDQGILRFRDSLTGESLSNYCVLNLMEGKPGPYYVSRQSFMVGVENQSKLQIFSLSSFESTGQAKFFDTQRPDSEPNKLLSIKSLDGSSSNLIVSLGDGSIVNRNNGISKKLSINSDSWPDVYLYPIAYDQITCFNHKEGCPYNLTFAASYWIQGQQYISIFTPVENEDKDKTVVYNKEGLTFGGTDPKVMIFDGKNERLAIGSKRERIDVYCLNSKRFIQRMVYTNRSLTSLAYSQNDQFLVAGHCDGTVRVFDDRGSLVKEFVNLGGIVKKVAFTEDASKVMVHVKMNQELYPNGLNVNRIMIFYI